MPADRDGAPARRRRRVGGGAPRGGARPDRPARSAPGTPSARSRSPTASTSTLSAFPASPGSAGAPGRPTVRVRAGTTVGELHEELDVPRPRARGVRSSSRAPTVGGALAVGMHGSGSAHGSLSAAVAGLRLVDGRGRLRDVTVADLDGARTSLGALGIVVEVELAVVPAGRVRVTRAPRPVEEVLDPAFWAEHAGRGGRGLPVGGDRADPLGRAAARAHRHRGHRRGRGDRGARAQPRGHRGRRHRTHRARAARWSSSAPCPVSSRGSTARSRGSPAPGLGHRPDAPGALQPARGPLRADRVGAAPGGARRGRPGAVRRARRRPPRGRAPGPAARRRARVRLAAPRARPPDGLGGRAGPARHRSTPRCSSGPTGSCAPTAGARTGRRAPTGPSRTPPAPTRACPTSGGCATTTTRTGCSPHPRWRRCWATDPRRDPRAAPRSIASPTTAWSMRRRRRATPSIVVRRWGSSADRAACSSAASTRRSAERARTCPPSEARLPRTRTSRSPSRFARTCSEAGDERGGPARVGEVGRRCGPASARRRRRPPAPAGRAGSSTAPAVGPSGAASGWARWRRVTSASSIARTLSRREVAAARPTSRVGGVGEHLVDRVDELARPPPRRPPASPAAARGRRRARSRPPRSRSPRSRSRSTSTLNWPMRP